LDHPCRYEQLKQDAKNLYIGTYRKSTKDRPRKGNKQYNVSGATISLKTVFFFSGREIHM